MTLPLTLERRMGAPFRAALATAGLFCVLVPAWELRYAFHELGWWSLFFGAIVLGAWSVGASFLFAALRGEAQTWRVSNGSVRIERRSPLFKALTHIARRDIASLSVREIEWDSRAPTFAISLTHKSGEVFETADYPTRIEAEAVLSEIEAKLALNS